MIKELKYKGFLPLIKSIVKFINSYLLGKINYLIYYPLLGGSKKNLKLLGKCNFMYPRNVIINDNIIIGNNVTFVSESYNGILIVDKDVIINENVVIDHSGNVIISDKSFISSNVKIYTHNHRYDPRSKPIINDLKIGKKVWIGGSSTIMPQCNKVGDNSIISYGSIVLCDVPNNSIYINKYNIINR